MPLSATNTAALATKGLIVPSPCLRSPQEVVTSRLYFIVNAYGECQLREESTMKTENGRSQVSDWLTCGLENDPSLPSEGQLGWLSLCHSG